MDTQFIYVKGVLEYVPTKEHCTVIFTLESCTKVATCKTVYRKIKGIPSYYFYMSKETIPIDEVIKKILKDLDYSESWNVIIPSNLNINKRLLQPSENESEGDFTVSGTWEDDNIFHK